MIQFVFAISNCRQKKPAGSLRLMSLIPLEPAAIVVARIDHQSNVKRPIEKVVADEQVHRRKKNRPARMRVVPTDHLEVWMESISFARNLAPRIVRKLEAAAGGFVVSRAERICHHNERLALVVDALFAQHDSAEFHCRVGVSMSFHVALNVEVDIDWQIVWIDISHGRDAVVRISIRPNCFLRLVLFDVTKLNLGTHIFYLAALVFDIA